MSLQYSLDAIDARLEGVVSTIDISGNGFLVLTAGGVPISTISLARPSGTVDGGVLTFDGTLLDPSAAATGTVDGAKITNASGAAVVTGLTVGIPLSGANVWISNGLNSTVISSGQVVQVLSAQITGS